MRMSVNPALQQVPNLPRLNLIFQGLMAFREAGTQYYDVLIPHSTLNTTPNTKETETCPHLAKYGNPLFGNLIDFPPGCSYYELRGVRDGAGTAARPSPANAVILRNPLLLPQVEFVRSIVRVPKPDVIRHYRGAETKDTPVTSDPATTQLVVAPPDVIHEVTVFSYFFFHKPILIGPPEDFPIPRTEFHIHNLCIYCQPLTECQQDDSGLFNRMFKLKGSGNDVKLNLFVRRLVADGEPVRTSIGIQPEELKALSELPQEVGGGAPDPKPGAGSAERNPSLLTSDPGGCGSAFVHDD